MNLKFAYFLKLFLIITLSTILLASVETAPDHPLLFLAVSTGSLLSIRMLWKSALKNEEAQRRQKIHPRKTGGKLPPDLKRAA